MFRRLLDGGNELRVVCLYGGSEMGKSTLLSWLEAQIELQQIREPFLYRPMDDNVSSSGLTLEIRDVLSDNGFCTKKTDEIIQTSVKQVNLTAITSEINVSNSAGISFQSMASSHEAERVAHLLINALVEDLERQANDRRWFLAFDEIEKSDSLAKSFIIRSILQRVDRLPGLHLVLSGRDLGEFLQVCKRASFARISESVELLPFSDWREIVDFVRSYGQPPPELDLEAWAKDLLVDYRGLPLYTQPAVYTACKIGR